MENGTIGPDMVLQVGMGEKEIPVTPVKRLRILTAEHGTRICRH